jgi:hypothetical protein
MGKPKIVGGLGWGAGNVALTLSSIIVVAVLTLAYTEARQSRTFRP